MCGFFGIRLSSSQTVPCETKLKASSNSLFHRGPDAQKIYSSTGLGLIHTRLSFLDVSERSHQPMWDHTGRYVLLYNGEIYNYQQLRAELEEEGVVFHTTSDTEVLLYSLIHFGPNKTLPRLNGMFAFAFYDTQSQTFVLSRDRFGMKPLYFRQDGFSFMFASEVKAFDPWVDLVPDKFMIASYLLKFGGPTKGQSFYEGIDSVAPGGIVTVSANGTVEKSHFFKLAEFLNREQMNHFSSLSARQIVDELDDLFTLSVQSHMFADVPVGAFCSGGVDSSLLMAKAAKSHTNLAIFHANVKGKWSEYHAARELAEHLKLDLISVDVEDQDFVDMLPQVMKHYEYPFTYHPNCAPLMMVARLARQSGVKGLISGEGSDECFLGYPWLGRKTITDAYDKFLAGTRSVVHKVPEFGKILWPHEENNSIIARSLLNRFEIDGDENHVRTKIKNEFGKHIPDETVWTIDYLNHHLRTLLHRNDTMGMEASIEARFPFLDINLANAAVNLPTKYKLRPSLRALDKAHPFVQDKWVVREVAARYLPRTLSHRKKLGFWTTVFKRIDIDPKYFYTSYAKDLFNLTNDQFDDMFARIDSDLAVRLLHLDVWGETCLRGGSIDRSTAKLREFVSIRTESS